MDVSFSDRIEKNVLDSDAIAILTHGNLTIGLKIVIDYAEKHNRPHLHVDLNENPLNLASALIRKWMINNQLETLYFTGSKAHNIALRKRAVGKGWKLNEYGLFDGDDRVAGATERRHRGRSGLKKLSC